MYTKLTIQERIRDLRQEKKLTLEQLADATGLSKSALGYYESNYTKDISHYAVIQLAKFYGVTTDYLLGISEQKTADGTYICPDRIISMSFNQIYQFTHNAGAWLMSPSHAPALFTKIAIASCNSFQKGNNS